MKKKAELEQSSGAAPVAAKQLAESSGVVKAASINGISNGSANITESSADVTNNTLTQNKYINSPGWGVTDMKNMTFGSGGFKIPKVVPKNVTSPVASPTAPANSSASNNDVSHFRI
jgi:hypothetical protein